jgi:hypothetical protein
MYWLCRDKSGTWTENSRRRPHFAIECLSSVVEGHDDMDTMAAELTDEDALGLAGQALYVRDEQVFAREVW